MDAGGEGHHQDRQRDLEAGRETEGPAMTDRLLTPEEIAYV